MWVNLKLQRSATVDRSLSDFNVRLGNLDKISTFSSLGIILQVSALGGRSRTGEVPHHKVSMDRLNDPLF
jgi:hypothetical protein